jgi:RNA polymerase sigma-70 factor (ECF subfamily)
MANLADRAQFEAAYRELAPLAQRTAESVLGDRGAAEDVVQELFLQLWRKPRSFDPARGTLRAYVVMLARSRALDRWRSRAAGESARARLAGEVRVAARESEDAAEQVVLGRDSRRRLLSVVRELPAEQRDAVLLAFGRGLTAREIAAGQGLPLGTAKSRVRLGLARVREGLGEAA